MNSISGNIVDVVGGRIFPGTIHYANGVIGGVSHDRDCTYSTWIVPGLIDAHVHIESSMLVPSEFARLAVRHGTVGTVSDPHEIGNVLGIEGVDYMIENGASVPFKFHFGAPSCVPATGFETAGATIGVDAVRDLLARPEILYLSEMMNYPGVIGGDPEVHAKLAAAHEAGKPVDGHAPAVRGDRLRAYIGAGISTDHESFTLDEAEEKIALGMKILIREGSAARNFNALAPLISRHPDACMFCSDDKHPDNLVDGHIDSLVRRALVEGVDLIAAMRCASMNAVKHYGLRVGLLQPGDPADIVEVDAPERFLVLRTIIDGETVFEHGQLTMARPSVRIVNRFTATPKAPEQLAVPATGSRLRVIQAMDGQIVTKKLECEPLVRDGHVVSDPSRDVLKLVLVNRYADAPPAVAFVRGFGLHRGALASSVAHDSHNLIAVGVSDEEICRALNAVIENRGGLAVSDGTPVVLPLPVAGLMSDRDGVEVAQLYTVLDAHARALGSRLSAPFMTLSFMALLVIPSLKISDKGLFDADVFSFTELQV
jgi:adenine deaminase